MDKNSLAHTKWNCKYHIVFTPKYRRQAIYKQISADIGQIIRALCKRKDVEIILRRCWYKALIGPMHATGYAGGHDLPCLFDKKNL